MTAGRETTGQFKYQAQLVPFLLSETFEGSKKAHADRYRQAYNYLLSKLQSSAMIAKEYQDILLKDYSIPHKSSVALGQNVMHKNRYWNTLPYDYNRVQIRNSVDYINASYVQYHVAGAGPCSYIATQGPLSGTIDDFWQMVFEHKSPAVLMLTNAVERGISKCCQYFPLKPGEVLVTGSHKVKVISAQQLGKDFICRSLRLKEINSGLTHVVDHYHYFAWPDHGTPEETEGIRQLCSTLDPIRDSSRPFVVHCSAGIGRTGTFCASDISLQRLKSWKKRPVSEDDVCDVMNLAPLVHDLRLMRSGLVQTLEQYSFCYNTVLDELSALVEET